MTKRSNKPVKSFKAGNIEASIWKQEGVKSNQTVTTHSVRIQKNLLKNGGYKKTKYYFRDDLPNLILVAQKAYDFIALGANTGVEDEIPF
jgi:hypothetical protein